MHEAKKGYLKCRTRKAKNLFLTRFVEETVYNRKHAIRLLQKVKKHETGRRGAPCKLTDDDIGIVLKICKHANYMNAEYLHTNIERWLKDISPRLKEPLSTKQVERICSVRYKTIERALKKWTKCAPKSI